MNKAFIFDLDGVLIDDESMWNKEKETMYVDLFGEEVVKKMGSTIGSNMEDIYKMAKSHGSTVSKQAVIQAFYDRANWIFTTAPLPEGTEELLELLKKENFNVGVVSASTREWIDIVLKRYKNGDVIKHIISLFDRPDLPHKPEPDGYQEAMKIFAAKPENTIILEDSNPGIASAKAAGAFVIGLRQNLVAGYKQVGADVYADTMEDVIKLILGKR